MWSRLQKLLRVNQTAGGRVQRMADILEASVWTKPNCNKCTKAKGLISHGWCAPYHWCENLVLATVDNVREGLKKCGFIDSVNKTTPPSTFFRYPSMLWFWGQYCWPTGTDVFNVASSQVKLTLVVIFSVSSQRSLTVNLRFRSTARTCVSWPSYFWITRLCTMT